MARRRRSAAQLSLVEGIESWHMPAAAVRGKLRKIEQYATFIDHPSDEAARRLIALEAEESLELLERFVMRWQAFWSLVYEAAELSVEETAAILTRLREEMRESWLES